MGAKVSRALKLAIKEDRWNGELVKGLTGMTPPVPKVQATAETSEDSSEE